MTHGSPNQDPFRAMADPDCRRILDLTLGQGIAQPSASQHMQVLRLAGLVDALAQGSRTFCSVRPSWGHLSALQPGGVTAWR